MAASTGSAIRIVASPGKPALIYLSCYVKPGASRQREGLISINDKCIEVCVSAPARDGKANKAVREVVSQAMMVPQTDVNVVHGLKYREKTLAVAFDTKGDATGVLAKIKALLHMSIEDNDAV